MTIVHKRGQLSKRNDPERVRRSFKRHALLVLQPFGATCIVSLIWTLMRMSGIHLAGEDTELVSVAIVNTLAIVFSLIYAVVLSAVWDNYKKVTLCILQEDKEKFLLYRDERMPIVMHLLLGAAAGALIGAVALLEWHSYWSGLFGVFSVTFVISFFWIGAAELQDPKKSPWMAERIPAAWFEEDVDERFYDDTAPKP